MQAEKAINFFLLAYQDYIASRFLLNNCYYMQGLTLASSAVEKYFKGMLCILGREPKRVHLDKINVLKSAFEGTEIYGLLDYLDSAFLEVLSKAYQFRYYDNIQSPSSIGFFVNQILGELDYTICAFETLIQIEGNETQYKQEVKNRNPDLFYNNYILNGWNKKKFMQRKSQAAGFYFNPQKKHVIRIGLNQKKNVPYNGHIQMIFIEE